MRRPSHSVILLGAALTIALVMVLPALPAGAHATFVGTSTTLPVNTQQSLIMNVPHERDDSVWNTEVIIAMPSGWQAQSCQTKSTWTCALGTEDGQPVVSWQKANGAAPAEDETFRFAVRTASTVGTYLFPTIQVYSDGEEVAWIGGSSSPEPAPVLKTVPQTTGPTTTVTARPPSHPTTTRTSTPSHSTAPGTPGTPAPNGPTTTSDDPDDTSNTSETTDTTTDDGSTTTEAAEDEDDDGRDEHDSDASGPSLGSDEEGSEQAASESDADSSDGGGGALALGLGALVVLGGAGAAGWYFLRGRGTPSA